MHQLWLHTHAHLGEPWTVPWLLGSRKWSLGGNKRQDEVAKEKKKVSEDGARWGDSGRSAPTQSHLYLHSAVSTAMAGGRVACVCVSACGKNHLEEEKCGPDNDSAAGGGEVCVCVCMRVCVHVDLKTIWLLNLQLGVNHCRRRPARVHLLENSCSPLCTCASPTACMRVCVCAFTCGLVPSSECSTECGGHDMQR